VHGANARRAAYDRAMRTLTLLVMILASCSDDPPNVGGACTATDGCDEALTCDTAVPGGYCTTACTTSGSTTQCPDGAVCDAVGGAALTCVKVCQTQTDCRADQDCNGTSGSNIKACKPKA
jgi:hypothetical protein